MLNLLIPRDDTSKPEIISTEIYAVYPVFLKNGQLEATCSCNTTQFSTFCKASE